MKICFLDFDDIKNPLLGAGQARATLEVGKRLAQKGHKIIVISSRYPDSQDRIENGIKYQHIGLGSKHIRINNIFYILCLPFTVRKIKADIIIECFTGPISTLFSPLFTKIPVVALPTCFEAEQHAKHYHLPFYLIERLGLRFYKYFLPYTKHYDEKMKKYNKKVISKIIPEGVGEEFFHIEKTAPRHILFLGRFDMNQKGIDLLLQAYAKIANKISYPLVLAGHGPDEAKIKQLIKKLDIEKNISLVGAAYGESKISLLSQSLFVAMPSRHEGFSLFSLEALAAGLPIVCFDIPGFSWTNEDVLQKAVAYDVDEYAKLLLKLYLNKQLIVSLSEKSRQFVKQYTWDNVVKQFEDFFLEIVKKEAYES